MHINFVDFPMQELCTRGNIGYGYKNRKKSFWWLCLAVFIEWMKDSYHGITVYYNIVTLLSLSSSKYKKWADTWIITHHRYLTNSSKYIYSIHTHVYIA